MNRLLTVILLLALSCSLFSCGDDDPVSSGGQEGGPHFSAEDFYPTAVGLLWIYEIHDAIGGDLDTVMVSVTDKWVLGNGETRFLWKYNFGDSVLVETVSFVNGSRSVYDRYGDTIPNELLILPPEIGNTWPGSGDFPDDTSIVVDSATLTTEAGVFRGTYRIDREWNRDFEGGSFQRSIFLCPKVGMVFRRDVRTGTDGGGLADTLSHFVWRLIGYNTYTLRIDQFPNSVGTEWVYEFFDSLANEYDTVTVTVGDTIQAWWDPDVQYRYWTYTFRDTVHTQEVYTDGGQIHATVPSLELFIMEGWRFPMAVGYYWEYFYTPELNVIRKDTIVVPAGEFGGGFYHVLISITGKTSFLTWLVPEVGIVRYDINSIPDRYIRWTLLSYNIVH